MYNSGATILLAQIFKKVTGKNIDDYAAEHLFRPLNMRYYWKHSATGLPDTEGGLYLVTRSGKNRPGVSQRRHVEGGSGFFGVDQGLRGATRSGSWRRLEIWVSMVATTIGSAAEDITWNARGFGGQQLMVLPEYDIVAVFTGWDILPSDQKLQHDQLARILDAANRFYGCTE